MRFDSWEIYYEAGDYDVYWPSLKLADQSDGELLEVAASYNRWTGQILRWDTISTGALLRVNINNAKSANDANYYDRVRFQVCTLQGKYISGLEYNFVFNGGQQDSLSFSALPNDDDWFVSSRDVSEQIIKLFCGKDPIDLKVFYQNQYVEGKYNFSINGSPQLEKGLALNHKREIIARKEFDKADRKAAKEFDDFF